MIHRPEVFAHTGWILSVTSALLIVMVQKTTLPRWAKALMVTPVLWVVTSPLVSPLAGGLFYSALPINMMVPLFTILLILALLAALLMIFALPGDAFFAEAGETLLTLWAVLADWWTLLLPKALPSGFFSPTAASALWLFLLAAALRIPWQRALAASALVTASLFWINHGPVMAL